MRFGTKIRILTAILVLIRSMMNMTRGLRKTSPVLIATISAVATFTAFVVTPKVCKEVRSRRVLS
ncbi:hypothetical protein [Gudongella sp. DL1XJH-153]|uniref:hypothetical protein n=1 Tax=Gudongella sp. DL1XJH-153 TaxID=3409804 RepID=UPI003BB493BF